MMETRIVVSLTQTCESCPSQWEGALKDGRALYIRYRWGRLSFGVGADIEEAVDACGEFYEPIGDGYDGYISPGEMTYRLRLYGFDFSAVACG
jgi:hypothetical protein